MKQQNESLSGKAIVAALLTMLAVMATGCATSPMPADAPLYQRLGGEAGVAAWVSEVIDLSSTDVRTRRSFDKVDLKRLKSKIAEHVCSLTGGGCKYSGDTMKDSHAGMKITEAEFSAMVELLREVLDRRVGEREKNELLKILAPMKRDIVTA